MSRARESFQDEDVYYKLVTTDDYVALAITTKKKTNVYIDRYTPVEGAVGDLNTTNWRFRWYRMSYNQMMC